MSEKPAKDGHAEALLTLAAAMRRYALRVSGVVGVLCLAAFGLLAGLPGLLGAAIGVVLAVASSLLTLFLMSKSAPAGPQMGMAALMGGFLVKTVVLMLVMTLLKDVDALHKVSLAATMAALIIAVAAAEAHAFRQTKLPTIIPADETPAST